MYMNRSRIMLMTAVTIALAFQGGCQSGMGPGEADSVFKDQHPAKVSAFVGAQAVAGAKEDPTLYRAHFAGDQLNSLGKEKLELIFADVDGAAGPSVLYLDLPKAEAITAVRQRAVLNHLKEQLHDDQFNGVKVVVGGNPSALTPTAPNLLRMGKTETGLVAGGSPDAGNGNSAPAAPAMGMK